MNTTRGNQRRIARISACIVAIAFIVSIVLYFIIGLRSKQNQKLIAERLQKIGVEVRLESGYVIGISFIQDLQSVTRVTDEHIELINSLDRLQWVHFDFTDLDDDKLQTLAPKESLTDISFTGSKVKLESIDVLDSFPSLWHISILMNQVSSDTESRLKKRFPELQITKLNLIDGMLYVDPSSSPR